LITGVCVFRPYLGAQFTQALLDAYAETGNPTQAQSYDRTTADQGSLSAGVDIAFPRFASSGFRPSVSLGYERVVGSGFSQSYGFTAGGGVSQLSLGAIPTGLAHLGLRGNWTLSESSVLDLNYSYSAGSISYRNHQLSLGYTRRL